MELIKAYKYTSLLLLSIFLSPVQSSAQSTEWKTWKNKVFTLQHPAEWVPVASNKNLYFLKLTTPADSSACLVIELTPGKGRTVEDLRDGVLKEFQGSSLLKTFVVEKNEIAGDGAASYYELIFAGEMLGKAEKIFIRGLVSADMAVQMSFTDPVATWAALEPDARKVMESFQRK